MPRKATAAPPAPAGPPDWSFEHELRRAGSRHIAGVDEAGRGPLAGPVVAAAVILPEDAELPGLDDSKRLVEPERERLFTLITSTALCWAVAAVEPCDIDRINILRATHRAMAEALERLCPGAEVALVDGLPVRGLPCEHQAVIGGDARCVSIAAASIVAKVWRDRLMVELDAQHPGYGLARHKGYSTPEHLAALRQLGPAPCHRRSFRPIAELLAVQELPLVWSGPGDG